MSSHELQNTHFEIVCSPQQATFNINTHRVGLPALENCRLGIRFSKNREEKKVLYHTWQSYQLIKTIADSDHGKLKQLEFSVFDEKEGVVVRTTFALNDEHPFFLWKTIVENQGESPIFIDRLDLLNIGYSNGSEFPGRVRIGSESKKPSFSFHSNGWQSWSFTGSYREEQPQRRTRLRFIQDVLVQNPGTPVPHTAGHYTSDFFGVLADLNSRTAFLIGFLSQKEQFGSIEVNVQDNPKIRIWANGDHTRLDPGKQMQTDWAVFLPFYLDQPDPISEYYEAVARENQVRLPDVMPSGWCSWYHFYQDIDEKKIRNNLESIKQNHKKLPVELIQIDDGFEKQVGDWYAFDKGFPNGVAPLASEIKAAGYTPGLWLAPFILHPGSDFVRKYPEMVLRTISGAPVNAGFVWNRFTQAIDLTYPGALEYTLDVIDTACHQWGFPYLKLDFLYAGALKGHRFDPTRTHAQILRQAMESIRRTVGKETFLLGCGAPLGSVLGTVDANRIGADVSGTWFPKYFNITRFFKSEPHMPSARNSIQNILTRAEEHNRWWINDPDCLLVRDTTELTLSEVQSLASAIAITGGSLLISDDLPELSDERMRIAEVLLPVIGKRAYVMDWLDKTTPHNIRLDLENQTGSWHLIARFNWKGNDREVFISFPDFALGKNDYWAYSFWNEEVFQVRSGDPLRIPSISAHGVALLRIQPVSDQPTYLGGNIHISMGLEVSAWNVSDRKLSCFFDISREAKGSCHIALPGRPQSARLDGKEVIHTEIDKGIYKFELQIDNKAHLIIQW